MALCGACALVQPWTWVCRSSSDRPGEPCGRRPLQQSTAHLGPSRVCTAGACKRSHCHILAAGYQLAPQSGHKMPWSWRALAPRTWQQAHRPRCHRLCTVTCSPLAGRRVRAWVRARGSCPGSRRRLKFLNRCRSTCTGGRRPVSTSWRAANLKQQHHQQEAHHAHLDLRKPVACAQDTQSHRGCTWMACATRHSHDARRAHTLLAAQGSCTELGSHQCSSWALHTSDGSGRGRPATAALAGQACTLNPKP